MWYKVIELFKHFFHVKDIEFGTMAVTPAPGSVSHEVSVKTKGNVLKVWFSISHEGTPVCGGGQCFVSEATPIEGGFVFNVQSGASICYIQWFAVVTDSMV